MRKICARSDLQARDRPHVTSERGDVRTELLRSKGSGPRLTWRDLNGSPAASSKGAMCLGNKKPSMNLDIARLGVELDRVLFACGISTALVRISATRARLALRSPTLLGPAFRIELALLLVALGRKEGRFGILLRKPRVRCNLQARLDGAKRRTRCSPRARRAGHTTLIKRQLRHCLRHRCCRKCHTRQLRRKRRHRQALSGARPARCEHGAVEEDGGTDKEHRRESTKPT
mmetsp:Transcript_10316/g.26884  ORF Transcript_10316/g.26884 Transcript_10316/m.26884 type:complete len:231 (-) Transcript_10316:40-732(-)